MATVFDSAIEVAHELVEAGGYAGLGVAILIESVFPPIPSEIILPLAGAQVSAGNFSFLLALLASTAGSVAGAVIIYAVARRGGRPLLMRYGRILRITDEDLDRADDWFDSYGGWIVLGGRLVPGARSLVSVPAGLSETRMRTLRRLTQRFVVGRVKTSEGLMTFGSTTGAAAGVTDADLTDSVPPAPACVST